MDVSRFFDRSQESTLRITYEERVWLAKRIGIKDLAGEYMPSDSIHFEDFVDFMTDTNVVSRFQSVNRRYIRSKTDTTEKQKGSSQVCNSVQGGPNNGSINKENKERRNSQNQLQLRRDERNESRKLGRSPLRTLTTSELSSDKEYYLQKDSVSESRYFGLKSREAKQECQSLAQSEFRRKEGQEVESTNMRQVLKCSLTSTETMQHAKRHLSTADTESITIEDMLTNAVCELREKDYTLDVRVDKRSAMLSTVSSLRGSEHRRRGSVDRDYLNSQNQNNFSMENSNESFALKRSRNRNKSKETVNRSEVDSTAVPENSKKSSEPAIFKRKESKPLIALISCEGFSEAKTHSYGKEAGEKEQDKAVLSLMPVPHQECFLLNEEVSPIKLVLKTITERDFDDQSSQKDQRVSRLEDKVELIETHVQSIVDKCQAADHQSYDYNTVVRCKDGEASEYTETTFVNIMSANVNSRQATVSKEADEPNQLLARQAEQLNQTSIVDECLPKPAPESVENTLLPTSGRQSEQTTTLILQNMANYEHNEADVLGNRRSLTTEQQPSEASARNQKDSVSSYADKPPVTTASNSGILRHGVINELQTQLEKAVSQTTSNRNSDYEIYNLFRNAGGSENLNSDRVTLLSERPVESDDRQARAGSDENYEELFKEDISIVPQSYNNTQAKYEREYTSENNIILKESDTERHLLETIENLNGGRTYRESAQEKPSNCGCLNEVQEQLIDSQRYGKTEQEFNFSMEVEKGPGFETLNEVYSNRLKLLFVGGALSQRETHNRDTANNEAEGDVSERVAINKGLQEAIGGPTALVQPTVVCQPCFLEKEWFATESVSTKNSVDAVALVETAALPTAEPETREPKERPTFEECSVKYESREARLSTEGTQEKVRRLAYNKKSSGKVNPASLYMEYNASQNVNVEKVEDFKLPTEEIQEPVDAQIMREERRSSVRPDRVVEFHPDYTDGETVLKKTQNEDEFNNFIEIRSLPRNDEFDAQMDFGLNSQRSAMTQPKASPVGVFEENSFGNLQSKTKLDESSKEHDNTKTCLDVTGPLPLNSKTQEASLVDGTTFNYTKSVVYGYNQNSPTSETNPNMSPEKIEFISEKREDSTLNIIQESYKNPLFLGENGDLARLTFNPRDSQTILQAPVQEQAQKKEKVFSDPQNGRGWQFETEDANKSAIDAIDTERLLSRRLNEPFLTDRPEFKQDLSMVSKYSPRHYFEEISEVHYEPSPKPVKEAVFLWDDGNSAKTNSETCKVPREDKAEQHEKVEENTELQEKRLSITDFEFKEKPDLLERSRRQIESSRDIVYRSLSQRSRDSEIDTKILIFPRTMECVLLESFSCGIKTESKKIEEQSLSTFSNEKALEIQQCTKDRNDSLYHDETFDLEELLLPKVPQQPKEIVVFAQKEFKKNRSHVVYQEKVFLEPMELLSFVEASVYKKLEKIEIAKKVDCLTITQSIEVQQVSILDRCVQQPMVFERREECWAVEIQTPKMILFELRQRYEILEKASVRKGQTADKSRNDYLAVSRMTDHYQEHEEDQIEIMDCSFLEDQIAENNEYKLFNEKVLEEENSISNSGYLGGQQTKILADVYRDIEQTLHKLPNSEKKGELRNPNKLHEEFAQKENQTPIQKRRGSIEGRNLNGEREETLAKLTLIKADESYCSKQYGTTRTDHYGLSLNFASSQKIDRDLPIPSQNPQNSPVKKNSPSKNFKKQGSCKKVSPKKANSDYMKENQNANLSNINKPQSWGINNQWGTQPSEMTTLFKKQAIENNDYLGSRLQVQDTIHEESQELQDLNLRDSREEWMNLAKTSSSQPITQLYKFETQNVLSDQTKQLNLNYSSRIGSVRQETQENYGKLYSSIAQQHLNQIPKPQKQVGASYDYLLKEQKENSELNRYNTQTSVYDSTQKIANQKPFSLYKADTHVKPKESTRRFSSIGLSKPLIPNSSQMPNSSIERHKRAGSETKEFILEKNVLCDTSEKKVQIRRNFLKMRTGGDDERISTEVKFNNEHEVPKGLINKLQDEDKGTVSV
jgi:hypothetical protein